MPKHRSGKPPHRPRIQSPPRRRVEPAPEQAADQDLMRQVRAALAESSPMALLGLVSSMLTVSDPRERDPFHPEDSPRVDRDGLLASFLEVTIPETSALLAVIAALVDEEFTAARLRREVAGRRHDLPRWVRRLDEVRVERVMEVAHVLGDGDNVMLGIDLAGRAMSALVYIDHNVGTLVKDAFVLDAPLDDALEVFEREGDADTTIRDLDPAEARARIEQAIDSAAHTYPPFRTDTWPACRPLVEWWTRLLPTGGQGYRFREWSETEREQLAERFLASPFGRPLDDEEHRDLLDLLLWFGCDYGTTDPLRWSAVAVEVLLLDFVPRKVIDDPEHLDRLPDVLRAFIRFAHAERGIRAELTAETLAAVEQFEAEYRTLIRSDRPTGPAAMLAGSGVYDPEEEWAHYLRGQAEQAVGGAEALAALDDEPLPDEPLRFDGVPADIHDRVGAVLGHVDRCCEQFFDVETRTACRRLLAAVARDNPVVFRRASRDEITAGAVVWIVGSANRMFGYGSNVRVKDLAEFLDLRTASFSQRATSMLTPLGLGSFSGYEPVLGSPDYLVSGRRRELIDDRDDYAP